jgi:hypothetical protein
MCTENSSWHTDRPLVDQVGAAIAIAIVRGDA